MWVDSIFYSLWMLLQWMKYCRLKSIILMSEQWGLIWVNSFSPVGNVSCFVFLWSLRSFIFSDIWKLQLTIGWPIRDEILSQKWTLPHVGTLSSLHLMTWVMNLSWDDCTCVSCTLISIMRAESSEMLELEWESWEQRQSWFVAWGWARLCLGRASRTGAEKDGITCRMTCRAADQGLFMHHHWVEDWVTQEKWRSH
jgi:hypothetical protein